MPLVTKPGTWQEPEPKTKPTPAPDSARWAGQALVCGYCTCGFTLLAEDFVSLTSRFEAMTQCPKCPMAVSFRLKDAPDA